MSRPVTLGGVYNFFGMVDGVAVEPEERQAQLVQNCYRFRKKLVRRGGQAQVGSNLTPNTDLGFLAWEKIGSTEYLIASHGCDLVDWFATPTAGAVITNGACKMAGTADCNCAWTNKATYIGDGIAQNVRFNGPRVDQAMVQDGGLSGSFAGVADGGAAGNPNGTYSYKFAFLSADGNAGQPSNATANVTVVSRKISVTTIPTCPAGQDCSARRLYRTKAGGSTYFFLADISDNVTTTYLDNIADTALGFELTANLAGNTRFPPCRYLVEWENRLIGAHCETSEGDLQTVYIGNVLQPWYCPASPDLDDPNQGTRATLQGRAAAEIMGLCPHGGVVVVFTGGTGHLLQGVEPNDFRLNKFCDHGCVAHRSIVSTRSLVIWLASDAVYQWDGQTVSRISDDVRETIESITASDASHASAFVWHDRYYLCWPTGCLYYDLESRQWGKLTNWLWRNTTVSVYTSLQQQRIWGSLTGKAQVYQLETGNSDSGVAIPMRWVSKDFDFGLMGREKRVHWLMTRWRKATGTATVALFKGTGESVQSTTFDISTIGDLESAGSTNEATARQMTSVVEQARSEFFKLDVSISSTDPVVELLGASCFYTLAT